ncbi:hypothetical protein H5410_000100 [Solanum commersonii]|uniref:Uncharacterized protein n=1 Tax=Solanum commersonii TaxID=4109 RepID=A0A9J6AW79_SOLCO|nr:hypothetical protein H5410_000100 [Solanum commersonii]
MTRSFPMNAGDGLYSYSKNSHLQILTSGISQDHMIRFPRPKRCMRQVLGGGLLERNNRWCKEMVRDAIIRKLDIKTILSSSNTIHITELGCSVGPNTFNAMQHIVEALKDKYLYQDQVIDSTKSIPEFQIFFNDQVTNDFNSLFCSLPVDRSYYASGVPGSFHDRLFPSRSIHFAHCSTLARDTLQEASNEL